MLNSKKLSALRSGNISSRYKDGFLITPSGKKYSSLKNKDIVFMSLNGKYDRSKGTPSSEWKFHQDIYKSKKEANSIVHSHSTNATAVSTHNKRIPPFHYMVAMAGGHDIKCANYATYGSRELSKNILKALKDRKACLIGNHGQINVGHYANCQHISVAFLNIGPAAKTRATTEYGFLLTQMLGTLYEQPTHPISLSYQPTRRVCISEALHKQPTHPSSLSSHHTGSPTAEEEGTKTKKTSGATHKLPKYHSSVTHHYTCSHTKSKTEEEGILKPLGTLHNQPTHPSSLS